MTSRVLTPGFSDAAVYVDEVTRRPRMKLHESHVFEIGSALRDELATVWEECREPNWDGFGALPVSQETLQNVYRLLESLPLDCPAPSIGAEPDGALTLEWHRSARRTLSVSVGDDGNLHFAGLFGPNRAYGTEAFFGEVSKTILELIRRVDRG
jgi:hypothetical protein